jgi:DNA-binding NarL/FixJ family response regulator
MAIRVLCVDDHPVVRNGISQIVGLQSDMAVVAAAGSGDEADPCIDSTSRMSR